MQVQKPKNRAENRVMLAKFRRFVVPEDQNYWMYQDPSEEDIKLAKNTSEKGKEIRKSTVSKIQ